MGACTYQRVSCGQNALRGDTPKLAACSQSLLPHTTLNPSPPPSSSSTITPSRMPTRLSMASAFIFIDVN